MDYELINLTITGVLMVAGLSLYVAMREKKRRVERIETELASAARKRAVKIVDEAQERALQILGEARLDTEARSKKLEARLDRMEDKEMTAFKKSVVGMAQNIEGEALAVVGQKVDEEVEKAKAAVAKYRQAKIAEIDTRAEEVIRMVTAKVLGKALDLAQHEQLVKQAIEEAKAENVL